MATAPTTVRAAFGLGLIASLLATSAVGQVEIRPEVRTVVEGTDFVTGIAFLPDGRMIFNERSGAVRLVSDGELRTEPLAEIATPITGETGLLGIAAPPDPSSDPAVYVFATAPDGASNRVLRVPLDLSEPQVVVDGLPAGTYHNGGGLAFDESGALLVSNGDGHESDRAQDPSRLGGKVYRFDPDGSVPAGNPFDGSPAFAIGLRNPYGLAVDPISGDSFVTENGPSSHDEINRIGAGSNHGWPELSGRAPDDARPSGPGEYRDPLVDYAETIVPTGIAFADPELAESEFAGDLFFGTYQEEAIHRVTLSEDRTKVESDEVFVDVSEPVIALAWGPDGLYYSTPDEIMLLPLARGAAARSPAPAITAPPSDEGPLGGRNAFVFAIFTIVAVWVLVRNRRKFR